MPNKKEPTCEYGQPSLPASSELCAGTDAPPTPRWERKPSSPLGFQSTYGKGDDIDESGRRTVEALVYSSTRQVLHPSGEWVGQSKSHFSSPGYQ